MSSLPVYNVSVPHLAQIPGGFYHGSMVRIKGTMTHAGDRFTINLQTGAGLGPSSDINLHLSVRPREHTIVRNHQQAGAWGSEERYGSCPIHVGAPFEIIVLSQSSAYKVAINGVHFCEFAHRLPPAGVRFVHVSGALTVQSISLERDSTSGPAAPPPPYGGGYPSRPPTGAVYAPAPPHHYPGAPTPPPPAGFYPGQYPGGPHGRPHHSPHHPPHHPHHQHHQHHHQAVSNIQAIMPMPQPQQPYRPPSTHYIPPPPPPPPQYTQFGPNPFDPIQQHQRAFVEAQAIKRQKRQKAMQYAAGGVGVGLGALALTSMLVGGGGGSDSD